MANGPDLEQMTEYANNLHSYKQAITDNNIWRTFFFETGQSQPLHQSMHTAIFITYIWRT
jgi:hypothetical protein